MNRRYFLATVSTMSFTGCLSTSDDETVEQNTDTGEKSVESIELLWDDTVREYLQDPLWEEKNRYDAGHHAMVPLHAAYLFDEPDWKEQFRDHVERFTKSGLPEFSRQELKEQSILPFLQYLYLMSRYTVLESKFGDEQVVPNQFIQRLSEITDELWNDIPIWQWARDDFDNMRERLNWKLQQTTTDLGFYQAVTDEDLFLFAIAADLYHYHSLQDERFHSDFLEDILQYAHQVYSEYGDYQPDGGWLFQKGIWSDHRDYQYACHEEKRADLEPCEIDDIAQDTSHSLRHPLWLESLKSASIYIDERQSQFYDDIQEGFTTQLLNHVIVSPNEKFPTYRLTNYMDGQNGLYRWEYETKGEEDGYGPYELSGSLTSGWHTFLQNSEIVEIYEQIASEFPLSDEVIDVYVGPNTTRDRHPLVTLPESYRNNWRKTIILLAAMVGEELTS